MKISIKNNKVMNWFKKLSLSKRLLLVLGFFSGLLILILTLSGKIRLLDGVLFVLIPVVLISTIAIFMVKLIFASLYERDYTGKLSPVYRRLLKNREKMGRDK